MGFVARGPKFYSVNPGAIAHQLTGSGYVIVQNVAT
jgi:hypothetical protein